MPSVLRSTWRYCMGCKILKVDRVLTNVPNKLNSSKQIHNRNIYLPILVHVTISIHKQTSTKTVITNTNKNRTTLITLKQLIKICMEYLLNLVTSWQWEFPLFTEEFRYMWHLSAWQFVLFDIWNAWLTRHSWQLCTRKGKLKGCHINRNDPYMSHSQVYLVVIWGNVMFRETKLKIQNVYVKCNMPAICHSQGASMILLGLH